MNGKGVKVEQAPMHKGSRLEDMVKTLNESREQMFLAQEKFRMVEKDLKVMLIETGMTDFLTVNYGRLRRSLR